MISFWKRVGRMLASEEWFQQDWIFSTKLNFEVMKCRIRGTFTDTFLPYVALRFIHQSGYFFHQAGLPWNKGCFPPTGGGGEAKRTYFTSRWVFSTPPFPTGNPSASWIFQQAMFDERWQPDAHNPWIIWHGYAEQLQSPSLYLYTVEILSIAR